jgi:DNA-directed RNA polymerase subunit H (RpoH/RPB5)
MALSSTRIQTIYKSRNTILELLKAQNYDTTDYSEFSINEIDIMHSNSQLDMLIKHIDNNRSVYIKYYLTAKQLRPTNLDEMVEDLYMIENVLTKADTFIIIVNEEPNDTIIEKIKYLYEQKGIFIVMHNIARLQYNILKHQYVPEMRILSKPEEEEIKTKYNLMDTSKLPEISRFDAQALVMNVRPGDVCHFKRMSPTSLFTDYYRICV